MDILFRFEMICTNKGLWFQSKRFNLVLNIKTFKYKMKHTANGIKGVSTDVLPEGKIFFPLRAALA